MTGSTLDAMSRWPGCAPVGSSPPSDSRSRYPLPTSGSAGRRPGSKRSSASSSAGDRAAGLAATASRYPAAPVDTPVDSEYGATVRTVRSAALSAVLLLALFAPSAQAATKTVAKVAQSGPVLAGSKVIYGVGRGSKSGSGTERGVDLNVVTV